MLAAHWNHGPVLSGNARAKSYCREGVVWILTDREGINDWGVRSIDLDNEDPPVVSGEGHPPNGVDFPDFSRFVAAMIVNDFLFDYETEEPVELNRECSRLRE